MTEQLNGNKIVMGSERMTGGASIFFELDGVKCKVSRMENPLARKVAAYQAMITELNIVKASLTLAKSILTSASDGAYKAFDLTDANLVAAYNMYSSSITTYAKCFAKTEGRGVKLESSEVKRRTTSFEHLDHLAILELRHGWTAHGGVNNNEYFVAALVFDPNEEKLPAMMYPAMISPLPSIDWLTQFELLTQIVIGVAHDKKIAAEKRFLKGKITTDYLEEHYDKAQDHIFVRDFGG